MRLDHEILAMHLMINALPPEVALILNEQLSKITESVKDTFVVAQNGVQDDLDDIRLSVLNMKFDLDATKSERDKYREMLDT